MNQFPPIPAHLRNQSVGSPRNLTTRLEELLHSKIEHVLFDGYLDRFMMGGGEESISILCREEVHNVARLLDLTRVNPGSTTKDPRYLLSTGKIGESSTIQVFLVKKGNGVFPERFETELLQRRVVTKELFYAPESETAYWCQAYMDLVYRGVHRDRPGLRRLYLEKLMERIGMPTKPRYGDLPFYPNA